MNKKEVPKKVVSIVAPSSGYKIAEYKSGLKYLKNLKDLDLEISSEPNLKNKADYLSAPDNLREKELSKSLFSKNIDSNGFRSNQPSKGLWTCIFNVREKYQCRLDT